MFKVILIKYNQELIKYYREKEKKEKLKHTIFFPSQLLKVT